jgi:hypothetical protein
MNSQNNIYWYSRNLYEVHEMPLHNPEVRVCYSVTVHKKIGPVLFEETVNPNHYISLILTLFFMEFTEIYSYFMQDSVMAKMANFSMIALKALFSKQVIPCGLWAPISPYLKHCNYSLCRTLKSLSM